MSASAHRMRIAVEHLSANSDHDEEGYEDAWLVVAYLDRENETRERVTLHCCGTQAEAAEALETVWRQATTAKPQGTRAA